MYKKVRVSKQIIMINKANCRKKVCKSNKKGDRANCRSLISLSLYFCLSIIYVTPYSAT